MGLRGFGHDDAVMADYVLLNDPTADSNGAVNCTMALVDLDVYKRQGSGRSFRRLFLCLGNRLLRRGARLWQPHLRHAHGTGLVHLQLKDI